MMPWIVCAVASVAVFAVWFIWRKDSRAMWSSGEIVLFVFFIFLQIIDVAQTYFAVKVIGFAHETIFPHVDNFNVWSAFVLKIAYILALFFFLRPRMVKISKHKLPPRFRIFLRYTILIVCNMLSWYTVLSNEIQAYIFIDDFM